MHSALDFLLHHGHAVLFVWVFAEQIGIPVPSMPILLAAGALAGAGRLDLGIVVAVAVGAALTSDIIWFHVGRARGIKVLQLLCRVSLEPDSCVRNTQDIFAKQGARSLLV